MKGQKIISTHSPFIVSQCNLDEIRHFKKTGCFTEVKSLVIKDISEEDRRKLRREILNTRGELLFAKVVVLFEGETEEQAIPILAEKFWNMHPSELGISFIGVGGQNYKPFLILLNSLHIECFIFSDGEEKTIRDVQKQIDTCFITDAAHFKTNNISFIPDNKNFEEYLIESGYSDEILKAVASVDGDGFVADYIQKTHGKSGGRRKTDQPKCDKCKQDIYEDVLRDYKNSIGEKQAILDIISKSKTKYAKAIAEAISEKGLPTLLSNLFKKIYDPIKLKQEVK